MAGNDFYQVWDWYDAPYIVRTHAPFQDGTWIVRISPGDQLPWENLSVSYKPEWDVHQQKIDEQWYVFIRDPENKAWPPFDPTWFNIAGKNTMFNDWC